MFRTYFWGHNEGMTFTIIFKECHIFILINLDDKIYSKITSSIFSCHCHCQRILQQDTVFARMWHPKLNLWDISATAVTINYYTQWKGKHARCCYGWFKNYHVLKKSERWMSGRQLDLIDAFMIDWLRGKKQHGSCHFAPPVKDLLARIFIVDVPCTLLIHMAQLFRSFVNPVKLGKRLSPPF